ncbi:MAG TPA: DEAD/DEAH box helicase, partial [Anaerolineae bacterium]|nr:DEAD/DEAH box helicase [Anaerolineae bacterium]
MDVFDFRNHLIDDYAAYINSFINVQDARIAQYIQESLKAGRLWPEPLIQLNPAFEPGDWVDELVQQHVLHAECSQIFRRDKDKPDHPGLGRPLRLHKHQSDAIRVAQTGANYVLTTGTGSGKSLAYIVPIVNHVLRRGSGKGVQAIVVYPMNALANSQEGELTKFLKLGYPDGQGPVTFARYTGQESDETRQQIIANPPDIILTNYVMLELILTRPIERKLIESAQGLRFLVLDELHTYRGRQGADVALLVRRTRDALAAPNLQCIGTSATLAGVGTYDEQRAEVAAVASHLFGAPVRPEQIIGETLRRSTPARDLADPTYVAELTTRVQDAGYDPAQHYEQFVADPLSIWIESLVGVAAEPVSGRMIRAQPRAIEGDEGAAQALSDLTGVAVDRCARAIQANLLAGYACTPNPETGFSPFAFKLHQFISRGDTVYASLEAEAERHITLYGQHYVPGDRSTVLLPLVFCRECGQEYYCVKASEDPNTGTRWFEARDLGDHANDENGEAGFIYFSTADPWPQDAQAVLDRVPEDWVEDYRDGRRLRTD